MDQPNPGVLPEVLSHSQDRVAARTESGVPVDSALPPPHPLTGNLGFTKMLLFWTPLSPSRSPNILGHTPDHYQGLISLPP